jgi:MFS family permease
LKCGARKDGDKENERGKNGAATQSREFRHRSVSGQFAGLSHGVDFNCERAKSEEVVGYTVALRRGVAAGWAEVQGLTTGGAATEKEAKLSARVAFTYPAFIWFEVARIFVVVSTEMQSVAVSWQIFAITHRALDLGLVGLAQFVPGILLFLVSGHAADRLDRKRLLLACCAGFATCSTLLLIETLYQGWNHTRSIVPIYAVVVLLGVVRSFNGPVARAILPQMVREEHFQNAVAWHSMAFQGATILGPSLGGLIYGITKGPSAVYATSIASSLIAIFAITQMVVATKARTREPISAKTVLAGMDYIWKHKVVLGSISLDLFAVLLGGAVALLPIYASDILKIGPQGLGLLRSAPAIGAGAMAILIANRPLKGRVGVTMLTCVALFGVFTIVFGLSRNVYVSLGALILVGASDMVSVVIRATLVQVATPDEMRGRVNAVDMIFIGASNELGYFESGLTAQWLGTVPSVVLGGIGTLVVTGLWAVFFPQLRNADELVASSKS